MILRNVILTIGICGSPVSIDCIMATKVGSNLKTNACATLNKESLLIVTDFDSFALKNMLVFSFPRKVERD